MQPHLRDVHQIGSVPDDLQPLAVVLEHLRHPLLGVRDLRTQHDVILKVTSDQYDMIHVVIHVIHVIGAIVGRRSHTARCGDTQSDLI